jgi:hypothetical protein
MMTFLQGSALPSRKKVKSARKYFSSKRHAAKPTPPESGCSSDAHKAVETPQNYRWDDQLKTHEEGTHHPKSRSRFVMDVGSLKIIDDKVWEDGASVAPTLAFSCFARVLDCRACLHTKKSAEKDATAKSVRDFVLVFFASARKFGDVLSKCTGTWLALAGIVHVKSCMSVTFSSRHDLLVHTMAVRTGQV